jgi:hypothetical protein
VLIDRDRPDWADAVMPIMPKACVSRSAICWSSVTAGWP